MTLWLRLTGTATPGRLGHWAPRPCQSRGRRGGSGPLIGWRAWPSPEPPRRLIGCAAQMTSSALSKKPAGRPLCSPQPIVGVGGPTSPPGPGAAQLGVNALAVGRCTWVRGPRGGGAGVRPRCDLWPYGHSSRPGPADARSEIHQDPLRLSVGRLRHSAPPSGSGSGGTSTNPAPTLTCTKTR